MVLHGQRVRTSSANYGGFILVMASSLWFRVYCLLQKRPFKTRFRFVSALNGLRLTQQTISRWLVLQKAPRHRCSAAEAPNYKH